VGSAKTIGEQCYQKISGLADMRAMIDVVQEYQPDLADTGDKGITNTG